jgi:hypothetical protein
MKLIVSNDMVKDQDKPISKARLEDYDYINFVTRKLEKGKRWVIEIESLDDLLNLKKQYGHFIISPNLDFADPTYRIKFYGSRKPSFSLLVNLL